MDIALQPVISLHGGRIVGFEALMRLDEPGAGDGTQSQTRCPRSLLDQAWWAAARDGACDVPLQLEVAGWRRAIDRFATLPGRRDARLFLNLDPRLLPCWSRLHPMLDEALARHALDRSVIALDLGLRHLLAITLPEGVGDPAAASAGLESRLALLAAQVETVRRSVGKIVLDDFGVGEACLPLLDALEPDMVKLDRYFGSGLADSQSRRLFLSTLTNVCHLLGTQVVAKGIERAADYHACREAGCDLVQGHLLAPPERDPARLPAECPVVLDLNAAEQRHVSGDQHLVAAQISVIMPLHHRTPMRAVFERFRVEKDQTFFPVVNEAGEPLGIVREVDLKEYTYSLYGKDLISNKALGRTLDDFVSRCPTVEIATRAEKILEAFSSNSLSEGLIITEDGRYRGFLTASSLLRVINEKNLATARDQNPLTKLPGNTVIGDVLADALATPGAPLSVVYLDFDNFKPFNDTYGFRQGDRAILLFAELMRAFRDRSGAFIGHIGGDDFCIIVSGTLQTDAVESATLDLIRKFEQDVACFYDAKARARGFIVAKDRHGIEREMPLLSASAAIVHLGSGHAIRDIESLSDLIAGLKKDAKRAPGKIAAACIVSPAADAGTADGGTEGQGQGQTDQTGRQTC